MLSEPARRVVGLFRAPGYQGSDRFGHPANRSVARVVISVKVIRQQAERSNAARSVRTSPRAFGPSAAVDCLHYTLKSTTCNGKNKKFSIFFFSTILKNESNRRHIVGTQKQGLPTTYIYRKPGAFYIKFMKGTPSAITYSGRAEHIPLYTYYVYFGAFRAYLFTEVKDLI